MEIIARRRGETAVLDSVTAGPGDPPWQYRLEIDGLTTTLDDVVVEVRGEPDYGNQFYDPALAAVTDEAAATGLSLEAGRTITNVNLLMKRLPADQTSQTFDPATDAVVTGTITDAEGQPIEGALASVAGIINAAADFEQGAIDFW